MNKLRTEVTKANIHQFVINLIDAFPKHIHGAIEDVFNELTRYALRDSRWSQEEYGASIHYFNAWKTNNGYKVNKKVIFPSMRESWEADKKLGMRTADFFNDIELVMSYLKPRQDNWSSMADICNRMLAMDKNRKIETEYFYVSIFKKGTIHLEFKDLNLLRRFNIEACKGKAFLPMDYAEQDYSDLNVEQKDIVNAFEGKAHYKVVKTGIKMSYCQIWCMGH